MRARCGKNGLRLAAAPVLSGFCYRNVDGCFYKLGDLFCGCPHNTNPVLPRLAVSGAGTLCVALCFWPRRSLCRGPAFCVRARRSFAFCTILPLSVSDPGVCRSLCRAQPLSRGLCWARPASASAIRSRGPQLRSAPPIRSARQHPVPHTSSR